MPQPEVIIFSLFPFFFIGMWLAVTTILSRASGWPGLSARFPDRPDETGQAFRFVSGVMGAGVNYSNCLTLTACPGGLRVSVMRVLGLFDRPFFVPWQDLAVERRTRFVMKRAVLSFGTPAAGRLEISARLADRLAAVQGRWPERGRFPATPTVT